MKVKSLSRNTRCMNPDCQSPRPAEAKYRGLCEACYRALKRLVEAGNITWAEAEEQGACLAPRPAGSSRWPTIAGAHYTKPSMAKCR